MEADMSDIQRIMVVAADIKHSQEAVRYGVSLARKYDAELLVLHVEHDPFGAKGWNLPFLSVDKEYTELIMEARKDLDRLIRTEAGKGLPVREMIRDGEPVGVIGKVVEEEKIDLLLLLSHEESRLEHFLFGRINDAIIRRMPCSILLVKDTGA
jgi:universal stress protein A